MVTSIWVQEIKDVILEIEPSSWRGGVTRAKRESVSVLFHCFSGLSIDLKRGGWIWTIKVVIGDRLGNSNIRSMMPAPKMNKTWPDCCCTYHMPNFTGET